MSKNWGILVLPLISTQVIANSNTVSGLCKDYLQPKGWQPIPGILPDTIDIQANKVELQGTDSAEFSGDVAVNTSTMTVTAESALIDKRKGLLNASGPLLFQDNYTKVNSSGMYADLSQSEFSLLGAQYELTEQLGRGKAEKLRATSTQVDLFNSSFTTCPSSTPFWAIEASTISLDKEKGWGETYNTVLKILDTPVIYVPYFTFPIDDKRKSGLLTPTLSSSNRYGAEIVTPYYLNLAENYDALLTPRYMSNKGLQLQGEFRYLTEQHAGLIATEFLNDDKSEPNLDERYLVHWQQKSYFNDNWRANIDVTNVSDDNYLTDLGSNYANQTDTQLSRKAQLSYLGDDWLVDLQLQNFEVLGNHAESYAAFPEITVKNRTAEKYFGVDWQFTGQLSHFKNDDAKITDATRIHLEPSVTYNINDYAWSFDSKLSLLHTHYEQNGSFNETEFAESISRTLPQVRLYGQLNLERNTDLFLTDGIQTLEPQIQYLYAPEKDQSRIGTYDTVKMQDDFFGLFRERRFSGVDYISEANQFTLGATTRLLDNKNTERFSLSVGQIIYLSNSAKPTENTLDNRFGEKNYNALFAAETKIHWHPRWYFSGGIQYDADEKDLIRSHMTIDYRGNNKKLVQLNHHYVNDVSGNEIDQVGIFTSLPIDDNWQVVASYHRDLTSKRSVEVFAGVQYESCCWAVQITGNRTIETDLNQSTNFQDPVFDSSINFNFVLKGLGSKSRYDASQLLKQGIFGYRRPYFLNN
ncbi:LPS biosynthesis protein [Pseudoalteromonas luteoviolacea]|uniref:LPS-assembly protein LptD n=1 Tax=Pseudoalteromonas luteoviolacea TaxID=43657 RepID=A0A0C1MJU4_9GAMM|nr:LPS assembly protein LptD [Pseudoalteromonas luteoviolacea]KID54678.1 LPS biosynthesis protein [Pseudoalteromonas luteoviolacea]